MHWNADGHRAVFEALREGVRASASLTPKKTPSSRRRGDWRVK
jgi:hypothetical protein